MASKLYAFVGIPTSETIYSKIINDVSKVEQDLDDMMDTLDASRKAKFVWATYNSADMTYANACAEFGKYMEHHIDKVVIYP